MNATQKDLWLQLAAEGHDEIQDYCIDLSDLRDRARALRTDLYKDLTTMRAMARHDAPCSRDSVDRPEASGQVNRFWGCSSRSSSSFADDPVKMQALDLALVESHYKKLVDDLTHLLSDVSVIFREIHDFPQADE